MARRGRGEGTIRHRSDGRWEATTTLGALRKSFYGKTRREVTEKLRAAQREYEQSQFVGDTRQTVDQYMTSWLESKQPDVKDSTLRIYQGIINTHITPVIGKVKLSALTAQHIQQVVTVALASGLKGQSAGNMYGVLHQALNAAERLGLIARDVSARVGRPHGKRHEMQPMSPEEANRFLDTSRGHWLEPLFRLALSTGMRQGELLGLTWRDVDLDGQRLSVVSTLSYRKGEPLYTTPKTTRSRRRIALAPEMALALRAHRHQQRAWRLRAGPAWQGDRYDAVFSDELGFPLRPGRLVLNFKKLLVAAALPRSIRFHDLRHTCATLLLSRGVHPKIVSEMLGHANISLTLDTYSHVLPHMQEDAARAIGEALRW